MEEGHQVFHDELRDHEHRIVKLERDITKIAMDMFGLQTMFSALKMHVRLLDGSVNNLEDFIYGDDGKDDEYVQFEPEVDGDELDTLSENERDKRIREEQEQDAEQIDIYGGNFK
jgi:hypothetical protein